MSVQRNCTRVSGFGDKRQKKKIISADRNKAVNARKERHALKEQIKQQQKLLKDEKSKYKQLHKQVDKMAKLMAETSEGEEEEDEEEETEESEEEEETESEEESESEESEEEESETDDEGAPAEKRKNNLQVRLMRSLGAKNRSRMMLPGRFPRSLPRSSSSSSRDA